MVCQLARSTTTCSAPLNTGKAASKRRETSVKKFCCNANQIDAAQRIYLSETTEILRKSAKSREAFSLARI
jgi:hypothetical protein